MWWSILPIAALNKFDVASYATILATQSIDKNRPVEIRIRDRVKYKDLFWIEIALI